MIKIKEAGQAFILVLIILAIGAVLIIPALRFTNTGLQSSQIISRKNTGLYAAEAAQQKIMWMLFRGTLAGNLTSNEPMSFTVDVCGAIVNATIVMRVVESKEGIILAGDDTIMVSKTVSPSSVPDNYRNDRLFTYEIELEQVSSNTTASLEAIYDILPSAFGKQDIIYKTGSSEISIDGGEWQDIDDPLKEELSDQLRLRWPSTGSFDSTFGQFEPAQVNKLRFVIFSDMKNDNIVACNWVVIKVGDRYTLSGPQAPITVGTPAALGGCSSDGLFETYKESYPKIIPPLVETIVTYDIHIRNMDGMTRSIVQIDDFLPPGFKYILDSTSNLTDMAPHSENQTYNGVTRQHIWWDQDQLTASGMQVAAGDNVTLTFRALAIQGISGSYYNEVMVTPKNVPSPTSFTTIDPDYEWSLAFSQTYSWNTGTVIVPAFDSETESDGETVQANLALSPLGVTINSWQVK